MLPNGLYEQIINKGLDAELTSTDKFSQTAPIDGAAPAPSSAWPTASAPLTAIT